MSTSANEVLAAFAALSSNDQRKVAAQTLKGTEGTGELPEEGLRELADELFQAYDAEEAELAG